MSTYARRYYPVRKTGNADNEREQLNKILKAIIDGMEDAGYTDLQKQIDAITYRINGLEIGQSTISEWGSIIGNIANQEDLYDFLQDLTAHINNTSNPHNVTKAQVGLSNVDNTSDLDKPISTATQAALDDKADAADLSLHTGDLNNPHNVTWDQTGADKAGSADAVAGDLEDHENLDIQQAHSGNLPENRVVFNTSSGHTHDGVDSAKVSYNDLEDKPSTMPPGPHGNEAHTVDFATEADLNNYFLINNYFSEIQTAQEKIDARDNLGLNVIDGGTFV